LTYHNVISHRFAVDVSLQGRIAEIKSPTPTACSNYFQDI
jgi:hypothetical protein